MGGVRDYFEKRVDGSVRILFHQRNKYYVYEIVAVHDDCVIVIPEEETDEIMVPFAAICAVRDDID